MTVFPLPPTFTNNQRISAAAHLMSLTHSVDWLIGAYQQDQIPFERRQEIDELDEAGDWWRVFTGYIYHKQDTLSYKFECTRDGSKTGEIRVMYDDTDLTPHPTFGTGAGTVELTGTLDASGVDVGIVRVTVDFRALSGGSPVSAKDDVDVDVVYLRETQSPSYDAMASFADATTPTAAQWQDLSDNANILYQQLIAPHRPMPGLVRNRDGGGPNTILESLLTHQHNYLFYDIRVKAPTNKRDPAHEYLFANFEVWMTLDGNTIFRGGYYPVDKQLSDNDQTLSFFDKGQLLEGDVIQRENGEKILLGPASGDTDFINCTRGYDGTDNRATQYGSQWCLLNPDSVDTIIQGDAEVNWTKNYSGVVDLASLGLSEGTDYVLKVLTNHDVFDLGPAWGGNENTSASMIGLIAEQTDDINIAAWIEQMISWSHGDFVLGDNGMKLLRDNLNTLTGLATYYNYPCSKAHPDASLWGTRRHRWLMYRHDEERTPKIGYNGGPTDGWTEVTLPTEPNKWLAFDMDSLKHFWPGMRYKITDCDFAIEDLVPYAET